MLQDGKRIEVNSVFDNMQGLLDSVRDFSSCCERFNHLKLLFSRCSAQI